MKRASGSRSLDYNTYLANLRMMKIVRMNLNKK